MATEKKMKYVVGQVKTNAPAIIRFFDNVDDWSVDSFIYEFKWVVDQAPSKILVLINSAGGNTIAGMSAFSVISTCPIEVETCIEGVAASMASIIWAAGKRVYMHDYSILMIHNPFVEDGNDDENTKAIIAAFKNQLATIYCKRFCMSQTEVEDIMNGKSEVDGTWFTADEAVEKGFLPASNVISTGSITAEDSMSIGKIISSRGVDGVKDNIDGLRKILDGVAARVGEKKLISSANATIFKNEDNNNHQKQNAMGENEILNLVAAQLGLELGAKPEKVTAVIESLKKAKAELDKTNAELVKAKNDAESVTAQLNKVNIELEGEKTKVQNFQKELEKLNASLKAYQDKEKAEKDAEINALVDNAIREGKIPDGVRDKWIAMATHDFNTVKDTLESVPAREVISQQIQNDVKSQTTAKKGVGELDNKLAQQVNNVVGDNFEFKKFD